MRPRWHEASRASKALNSSNSSSATNFLRRRASGSKAAWLGKVVKVVKAIQKCRQAGSGLRPHMSKRVGVGVGPAAVVGWLVRVVKMVQVVQVAKLAQVDPRRSQAGESSRPQMSKRVGLVVRTAVAAA